MKKYNRILVCVVIVYFGLAVLFYVGYGQQKKSENMTYKTEMNQVMQEFVCAGDFFDVDLSEFSYLQSISFLPQEETADREKTTAFYQNHNGVHSSVSPLIVNQEIKGMVRFDYMVETSYEGVLFTIEAILGIAFLIVIAVLVYIRVRILKPFHTLGEMPYELAKGHLTGELTENKNRYFGRFLWGISMLRDTLNDARAKELKLVREKKLLLLSLSHDIKIPLSAIKLYAKALRENIYDTKEQQLYAAKQIEVHAQEIEMFVKEIAAASSEDVVSIEVENGEFYLKDYVEKIRKSYAPKCQLRMTEFTIGVFENRLLKGDMERAFEVMENLLENAFKYGDGIEISIDFYEEDYCQIIQVFNSGQPVTDMELPHLFDSFYRGSNAGSKQGNGLGLYISRQIMQKMGGDIFAKRCEDGMNFCLVFPM
ncbi:MAG: sensor histidine kinase [Roseburia sp.]